MHLIHTRPHRISQIGSRFSATDRRRRACELDIHSKHSEYHFCVCHGTVGQCCRHFERLQHHWRDRGGCPPLFGCLHLERKMLAPHDEKEVQILCGSAVQPSTNQGLNVLLLAELVHSRNVFSFQHVRQCLTRNFSIAMVADGAGDVQKSDVAVDAERLASNLALLRKGKKCHILMSSMNAHEAQKPRTLEITHLRVVSAMEYSKKAPLCVNVSPLHERLRKRGQNMHTLQPGNQGRLSRRPHQLLLPRTPSLGTARRNFFLVMDHRAKQFDSA